MIYLIGGTAKSGKTYLANKLLAEKNISNFSTDYLMMALSKVEALDIKVDTEDDRSVARKLAPFLETMIEAMIYNEIDYLIEGVHITPSLVSDLIRKHPNKIRTSFLGYTDILPADKKEDLINHRFRMQNCWYQHYSDGEMHQLVTFLIDFSKDLKKECQAFNMPYIEVYDITKQASNILNEMF